MYEQDNQSLRNIAELRYVAQENRWLSLRAGDIALAETARVVSDIAGDVMLDMIQFKGENDGK